MCHKILHTTEMRIIYLAIYLSIYLSDILTCQNMALGRFMVGAVPESRIMRSECKKILPCRYSVLGGTQALTYNLNPASRQIPGEAAPWDQDVIVSNHNRPARMPCNQFEPKARCLSSIYLSIYLSDLSFCRLFSPP